MKPDYIPLKVAISEQKHSLRALIFQRGHYPIFALRRLRAQAQEGYEIAASVQQRLLSERSFRDFAEVSVVCIDF